MKKHKKKPPKARVIEGDMATSLDEVRLVSIRRKLLNVFKGENLLPADALHVMVQLAGTFAATQGVGRLSFLGACSKVFGQEKKRMLAAKVNALENS